MNFPTAALVLLALVPSVLASGSYCPPGNFISDNGCVPCPDGLFQPNANSRECWTCPLNSSPNAEKDLCICAPGTAWDVELEYCNPCPAGTFTVSGDMFTCHPCPPQTYQPSMSSTSCLPCQTGSFSSGRARFCSSCPPGLVLINGECSSCPGGLTYNARTGACTDCRLGIIDQNGQCTLCPAGRLPNAEGTACNGCTLNQAPLSDGTCGSCNPGERYNAASRRCVPCGPGEFSPSGNVLSTCQRCPPPTRPNAERTSCVLCRGPGC